MVKDLYSSYKDLPLSIYQIQTKYRDEARPRAGLLRGREFIMKDSYSFDVDDAGLDGQLPGAPRRLRADLRPARLRVRHRRGHVRAPWAGRKSEEFLAKAEVGEDTYVPLLRLRLRRQRRGRAGAAARPRRRTTTRPPRTPSRRPTPPPSTPWSTTSTRSSRARTAPGRQPTPSRTCWWCSSTPTAPGSRSRSACPGTGRWTRSGSRASWSRPRSVPFDESEFAKHPGLVKGYIGPGTADAPVLGEKGSSGIRYLVDPRVVEGTRWVTGANLPGSHVLDLVAGRDFTPDGTIEAAEVRDGDPCPVCDDGVLEAARGIEMGHIFQLGPQVRRGAGPPGARRERQARHGHDGLLRHRAVPCGRGDRRGHPRRPRSVLAPRTWRPADVHLVAAGKDEARARRRRAGRRTSSAPEGSRCSSTTGRRSAPG